MRSIKIKATVFLFAAVFALAFAACGSGGGESSDAEGSGGQAAKEAVVDSTEAVSEVEMLEEPAAAGDSASSYDSGETTVAPEDGSAASLPDANRKITFSASYTIETKAYDGDYAKIVRLVNDAGGYIASEETVAYPYESEGMTGRSSYFSLKIPVGSYDSFLGKLEAVGEVSNKNKSSEDLTAEYFDTESRIEILKMRRDRLTEYIKNATKSADIVEFERELSEVLIELDNYEGNKRRLDQLVDYATVDVSLNEMITPETIGKDGQPLGSRASDAFRVSATGVGEFLQNAAVFFAGAAPVIALIVAILVVLWLIVRYVRRVRAKYYEAHPERRRRKEK